MDSPLKGLERLSEELKTERQKLNIALQERARVRLECENYKQTIEQQKFELNELHEALEELRNNLSQSNEKVEDLQRQRDALQADVDNKAEQYQEWLQSSETINSHTLQLEEQLHGQDEENKSLRIHIETLERKGLTKDSLISSLKAELVDIRKAFAAMEQQKLDTVKQLSDREVLADELQTKLQLAQVSDEGQQLSYAANEELRSELEQSLQLNTTLNQQLRELNDKVQSKSGSERQMQDLVRRLEVEKERLLNDLSALHRSNESLQQAIEAEHAARDAANQRCETVVRSREFLDQQIDELREAHRELEEHSLQLEGDLVDCRHRLDDALLVIEEKDSLVDELMAKAGKAEEMAAMSMEMDSLRGQLVHLRKQMIKRDLEDQAGVLPPRAIIDRETNGRTVYEGIIQELRSELEKMTLKHDDAVRRYDVAMDKASRVEHLEEEVAIYREMAHSMSQESQTVALAASEAVERNMKHTHDRQHILHELHNAETALQSSQGEVRRLKSELDSLRDKMKQFHADKLSADKRTAEIFSANSRTETALEELRQQYDVQQIELEKAKRVIHEYTFRISDLQKKEAELSSLRADHEKINRQLELSKTGKVLEQEELLQEGERAKQQRDLLRQDAEAQRIRVAGLQRDMDKLIAENQRLAGQLETALHEKEAFQTQILEEEQGRVEQHMAELKRDLAMSLSEWQDLEREKGIKDGLLQQLQADFAKEKERSNLLAMQVSVLTEKNKIAGQELSVYRSIDVYHHSLTAELRSYREDKASTTRHAELPAASVAQVHHQVVERPAERFDLSRSTARLSLEEIADSSVDEGATSFLVGGEADAKAITPDVSEEEKRKQEVLLQRSLRKAAREQQLRQQLLQEERGRAQGYGQEQVTRWKERTIETSPLKAKMLSRHELQRSLSSPALAPQSQMTAAGTTRSIAGSLSSTARPIDRSGLSARPLSSSAYLQSSGLSSSQLLRGTNSQSQSALSKAKQDLDRARRLISM